MFWSAAPGAATTPGPTPLDDAHHSATTAASWVQENWSTWLSIGLRIALILFIALVLRTVVRRAITKLIERMNRTAQAVNGTTLGGLLINAERRRQRSAAIGSVLRSVASFLIMGTAALMVLSTLEINLAPLLASAGVAGVAIGFGARNLVTDFLSGVFMILEDQYGVGDSIDAGVASGEVIEVGLRITKLRGSDGAIWYVRNGEIKRIGNLSQGWSMAGVDVQLAAGEDLEAAREVIVEVCEEMAKSEPWNERLWGPIEVLGLDSVSLDSMVIQVSAKTMPGQAPDVQRELRWRIKRALDSSGTPNVATASVTAQQQPSAAEGEAAEPGEQGPQASPPPASDGPALRSGRQADGEPPRSEAASGIPPQAQPPHSDPSSEA